MEPTSCRACGREHPNNAAAALVWTRTTDGGSETWLCPACTREHTRSIEARLDEQWW